MNIDLLGFDHAGRPWSWPEFDDLTGSMTRPAHAHAGRGSAACGATWPHIWNERVVVRDPIPGEAQPPTRYVPSDQDKARIRDAEDRSEFLCKACLLAIN